MDRLTVPARWLFIGSEAGGIAAHQVLENTVTESDVIPGGGLADGVDVITPLQNG